MLILIYVIFCFGSSSLIANTAVNIAVGTKNRHFNVLLFSARIVMAPKLNLNLAIGGSAGSPQGFGSIDDEAEILDLNDSLRVTNQGALQVRSRRAVLCPPPHRAPFASCTYMVSSVGPGFQLLPGRISC